MADLPLEDGQPTRRLTLTEIWFSLPLQPLVSSISPAGCETLCSPPSPGWYFLWWALAQVLWTLLQPLWVRICSCASVPRKHCFSLIICHLWFLQFPLLQWSLRYGRKGHDIDATFRIEHPTIHYSLCFDLLCISVLLLCVIYCKSKLLWWEEKMYPFMGKNLSHQKSV